MEITVNFTKTALFKKNNYTILDFVIIFGKPKSLKANKISIELKENQKKTRIMHHAQQSLFGRMDAQISGHKNAYHTGQILNGWVIQRTFIITGLVPNLGKWNSDQMHDRNTCRN